MRDLKILAVLVIGCALRCDKDLVLEQWSWHGGVAWRCAPGPVVGLVPSSDPLLGDIMIADRPIQQSSAVASTGACVLRCEPGSHVRFGRRDLVLLQGALHLVNGDPGLRIRVGRCPPMMLLGACAISLHRGEVSLRVFSGELRTTKRRLIPGYRFRGLSTVSLLQAPVRRFSFADPSAAQVADSRVRTLQGLQVMAADHALEPDLREAALRSLARLQARTTLHALGNAIQDEDLNALRLLLLARLGDESVIAEIQRGLLVPEVSDRALRRLVRGLWERNAAIPDRRAPQQGAMGATWYAAAKGASVEELWARISDALSDQADELLAQHLAAPPSAERARILGELLEWASPGTLKEVVRGLSVGEWVLLHNLVKGRLGQLGKVSRASGSWWKRFLHRKDLWSGMAPDVSRKDGDSGARMGSDSLGRCYLQRILSRPWAAESDQMLTAWANAGVSRWDLECLLNRATVPPPVDAPTRVAEFAPRRNHKAWREFRQCREEAQLLLEACLSQTLKRSGISAELAAMLPIRWSWLMEVLGSLEAMPQETLDRYIPALGVWTGSHPGQRLLDMVGVRQAWKQHLQTLLVSYVSPGE